MIQLLRRSLARGGGPDRAFRFSPRALGATIGLFAVGYLILAFNVPDFTATEVPVQPNTLPQWLGVTLLILSVLLFFQHDPRKDEESSAVVENLDPLAYVEPQQAEEHAVERAERLGRFEDVRLEVLALLGSMAAYVVLFEPLGFILATAAYLAGNIWYLGYRRHLVTAIVALGVPLALYAAMTWVLDVVLPRGPLPF